MGLRARSRPRRRRLRRLDGHTATPKSPIRPRPSLCALVLARQPRCRRCDATSAPSCQTSPGSKGTGTRALLPCNSPRVVVYFLARSADDIEQFARVPFAGATRSRHARRLHVCSGRHVAHATALVFATIPTQKQQRTAEILIVSIVFLILAVIQQDKKWPRLHIVPLSVGATAAGKWWRHRPTGSRGRTQGGPRRRFRARPCACRASRRVPPGAGWLRSGQ